MTRMNSKSLLDPLQCVICYTIVTPPVSQCKNGHISCVRCIENLVVMDCPVCREGQVKYRNLYADQILKDLDPQVKCPYQAEGCQEILNVSKLEAHEVACQGRPVFCPSSKCKKKLSMRIFKSHILQCHSYRLVSSGDYTFMIKLDDLIFQANVLIKYVHDIITVVTLNERVFLFHVLVVSGKLCIWVSGMTETVRDSEKGKYKFKLMLRNSNYNLEFSHDILSLTQSHQEVLSNKNCFVVTPEIFNCFQQQKVLWCQMKIVKT